MCVCVCVDGCRVCVQKILCIVCMQHVQNSQVSHTDCMTKNYVRAAEMVVSAGTGWSLHEYDNLLITRLLSDGLTTQQLDYPIVLHGHHVLTGLAIPPLSEQSGSISLQLKTNPALYPSLKESGKAHFVHHYCY